MPTCLGWWNSVRGAVSAQTKAAGVWLMRQFTQRHYCSVSFIGWITSWVGEEGDLLEQPSLRCRLQVGVSVSLMLLSAFWGQKVLLLNWAFLKCQGRWWVNSWNLSTDLYPSSLPLASLGKISPAGWGALCYTHCSWFVGVLSVHDHTAGQSKSWDHTIFWTLRGVQVWACEWGDRAITCSSVSMSLEGWCNSPHLPVLLCEQSQWVRDLWGRVEIICTEHWSRDFRWMKSPLEKSHGS